MRRNALPWILFAIAVVVAGFLAVDRALMQVRISYAVEQTAIFEELRQQAESANPQAAIAVLQAVLKYYPSGTKQSAGSQLDIIVERARTSVVRDILARLRQQTGQNYGDDPQDWINAFGKSQ